MSTGAVTEDGIAAVSLVSVKVAAEPVIGGRVAAESVIGGGVVAESVIGGGVAAGSVAGAAKVAALVPEATVAVVGEEVALAYLKKGKMIPWHLHLHQDLILQNT